MAQNPGRSLRIARLTATAEKDLFAIYTYTTQQWGAAQAEDYRKFLWVTIQRLADRPAAAPLVRGQPGTRCHLARWKNARLGHRIFFRETGSGIIVIRILHSSMNWLEHLEESD